MAKYITQGENIVEIAQPNINELEKFGIFQNQAIKFNHHRGVSDPIELELEDSDIVNLEFDDGTEWLGTKADFHEILELEENRATGVIQIPHNLRKKDSRGNQTNILFNFMRILKVRNVAENYAVDQIAKMIDRKLVPEQGVFQLNERLEKKEGSTTIRMQEGRSLLFIHGTISSISGSFRNLANPKNKNRFPERESNFRTNIFQKYNGRIYGLEHWTISESPIKNAILTIEQLPDGAELDIISGSRGGLVADLLARCSQDNAMVGFSQEEIEKVGRGVDNKIYQDELNKLNALIKNKKITVHRQLRVSCPANGTTLLSDRTDRFLLRLMSLAKFVPVIGNSFPFVMLKALITKILERNGTPEGFPGLESMRPDSPIIILLNNPSIKVNTDLYIIKGNANKRRFNRIAVFLASRIFDNDNDLIVDTASMTKGVSRNSPIKHLLSDGAEDKNEVIHHLNYFKNQTTVDAIFSFTKQDNTLTFFQLLNQDELDRGGLIASLNYGDENTDHVGGNKDIVVLLPGIMGSHLSIDQEKMWLSLPSLIKGNLVNKLAFSAQENQVNANSLVSNYYSNLVSFLKDDFDVVVFPYDWRAPLESSAKLLKEKLISLYAYDRPIKIIAHSMGGLVVRQVMMDYKQDWIEFIHKQGSRFIMLGTPWLGSHAIMEFLTGQAARLKLIHRLDLFHTKKEILDTIRNFPGLLQLLPIQDPEIDLDDIESDSGNNFGTVSFWRSLNKDLKPKHRFEIPTSTQLKPFTKTQKEVLAYQYNFENCIYVAGKGDLTISAYAKRDAWNGKEIVFLGTHRGDGTVTWKRGIPKEMESNQVYYADVSHGELSNDPSMFLGIKELLTKGTTRLFSNESNATISSTRFGSTHGEDLIKMPVELIASGETEIIAQLLGNNISKETTSQHEKAIQVEIVHGDLRESKYPVFLGHFAQDGIVSAEGAMDAALAGRLTERHDLGNYPQKIGDSQVIIVDNYSVPGAVIVGLGDNSKLTPFQLQKTIRMGILEYAFHMRDHYAEANIKPPFYRTIAAVGIGSAYARLSVEQSLSSILIGINEANEIIAKNDSLKTIEKIQIVELFKEKAQLFYHAINKLQNEESRLEINAIPNITIQKGGLRKLDYVDNSPWWHDFSTSLENSDKENYLRFQSSAGLARVEQQNNFSSQNLLHALLKDFSEDARWDERKSKTLFEILIPNSFKDVIRSQNHILWKLDKTTASYPWELFHDYQSDKKPTFVNAGLIRQLITRDYTPNPKIITTQSAIVIGDPIYNTDGLAQLSGARKEGEDVLKLLENANFTAKGLIGKEGIQIIEELYNSEVKVLHIAGHGVFKPNLPNETGPVLGKGMILSSALIKSLPTKPEFVFINCCYSGKLDPDLESYYQERFRFASNIGIELIEQGVNAVVVAGWAVDDAAALEFAQSLYQDLLRGETFGIAVKNARYHTYENHHGNNTWGAYQCYGDPHYKLVKTRPNYSETKNYITQDQIEVELYNLTVEADKAADKPWENSDWILEKLNKIIKQAESKGLYSGKIAEMEAAILSLREEHDLALDRYNKLLQREDADYSIKSFEQQLILNLAKSLNADNLTDDDLSFIKGKFDDYLRIGKTKKRLELYGESMKKLHMKASNNVLFLIPAKEIFHEAYFMYPEKSSDAVWSLINLITMRFFLKKDKLLKTQASKTKVKKKVKEEDEKLTFQGKTLQDQTIINRAISIYYKASLSINDLDLNMNLLLLRITDVVLDKQITPDKKKAIYENTRVVFPADRKNVLAKRIVDHLAFLLKHFETHSGDSKDHIDLIKKIKEIIDDRSIQDKPEQYMAHLANNSNAADIDASLHETTNRGWKRNSNIRVEMHSYQDNNDFIIPNELDISDFHKEALDRVSPVVRQILDAKEYCFDVHMHLMDKKSMNVLYSLIKTVGDTILKRGEDAEQQAKSYEEFEQKLESFYDEPEQLDKVYRELEDHQLDASRAGGKWHSFTKILGFNSMKKILELYEKEDSLAKQFINPQKKVIVGALMMDFEMGQNGAVVNSQLDQIGKLKELSATKPILPFLFCDPRRAGLTGENNLYFLFKRAFSKNRSFFGIKLYPGLGYSPKDKRLYPIYKVCEQLGIPIVSHCGGEDVSGTDNPTKVYNGNEYITIGANRRHELAYKLNDPSEWKSVLQDFPQLRLNIAHFGSSPAWTKGSRKQEKLKSKYDQKRKDTIISLINNYDHVYTDLSYTFTDHEIIHDIKKEILKNEKLRKRVLFGTDYWVVFRAGDVGVNTTKFFNMLDDQGIKEDICIHNPYRFLFGKKENDLRS